MKPHSGKVKLPCHTCCLNRLLTVKCMIEFASTWLGFSSRNNRVQTDVCCGVTIRQPTCTDYCCPSYHGLIAGCRMGGTNCEVTKE